MDEFVFFFEYAEPSKITEVLTVTDIHVRTIIFKRIFSKYMSHIFPYCVFMYFHP